jgi:hypothetical protein
MVNDMILLTNGDSWTQGDSPAQNINLKASKTLDWYDIPDLMGSSDMTTSHHGHVERYKFYESDVWPKVLGGKLKIETLNAGLGGNCNRSISERTINLVSDLINKGQTEIFCIIGWSSSQRVSVFELKENFDGKNKLNKIQYRPMMKNTREGISDIFYDNTNLYQVEHLHSIINLQNFLKINNVNYLMFNAFDKFELNAPTYLNKLIDLNYWIDGDMKKAHFKDYIINNNSITDWDTSDWFVTSHPTDKSHVEWGNYLYKYITNTNIII